MSSAAGAEAIEWRVTPGLTDYASAVAAMEARAAAIRDGGAGELVWLLEHPPLITAGTSAPPAELIDPNRFPVHRSGRGGRHTYHGPGQRVGYVLLDLEARGRDVRRFVAALENWLVRALARLGVAARTAEGRIGIWVDDQGEEAKIGAIGVRVRRWVTLHGFALNLSPDLSHFDAIIPCGLPDFRVTSLAKLGVLADLAALDAALAAEFGRFLCALRGNAFELLSARGILLSSEAIWVLEAKARPNQHLGSLDMNIVKKATAVAMVATAALALSACGKTETTNVTENTTMTDMNASAPAEGSMNDMSMGDMNSSGNMGEMNAMGDNSMMGSNSSNMM